MTGISYRASFGILTLFTIACVPGAGSIASDDVYVAGVTGSATDFGEHLDLTVIQTAWPVPGVDGEVSVPFELTMSNRTGEPVEITRVTMSSVGDTRYRILRTSRPIEASLEGGETFSVDYWARASVVGSSTREPLLLRVVVTYEKSEESFEEIFSVRSGHRFAGEVPLD